ncbi:zinc transporter 4 [Microcaecilia unicolor]|uniref:Probable proton-coupled zinc antiporter SLC30A4 n=1 Tax=Microcaecilia unicolor TaxID=1415580 RepID=A0A6P7WQG1_9AMPH|nr:zinc transporter 4-like [Microcaecilia unicolor]
MARPKAWWSSLAKLLVPGRREPPLYLSDACSALDLSDEAPEEDTLHKFNKLRVVVSEDVPSVNGGQHAATTSPPFSSSSDDSLLEHPNELRPSPLCGGCRARGEQCSRRTARNRLLVAGTLYFFFMLGELVGGYVSNSLAIMTDALHILTDLSGIILTLLALWLSAKSPTKRFTFGFHRLEVLSAVASVLLVYILTAFLLYEAVQRTIFKDYEINGDIMLITAALGVAVNIVMGFLLKQSGHPHSHHPPTNTSDTGVGQNPRQDSLAVRAAFVHALGDLVQSVGVLVAAYIIRFKPEYKIADPICTYVFSLLVIFTTLRIMRDTIFIILEGVPLHLNVDRIKEDIMKIEDVHSVEHLYIWSLTTGKSTAIVHLLLNPGSSSKWEEVQSKTRNLLLTTYGLYQCSVDLQTYRQEVSSCASCQNSAA